MAGFTASDLKNVLYLFPVLSALICFVCVKAMRKSAARAVASSADADDNPDDETAKWRKLDLFGNDPHASPKGPFGIGGSGDQEMLPVHEKHVGLVIEYNDAGLEAHARKAKISQNNTHTAHASRRTSSRSAAPIHDCSSMAAGFVFPVLSLLVCLLTRRQRDEHEEDDR